jgi:hypothetical protein
MFSRGNEMDEPLRLEGFDTSIRGRRTLIIGPHDLWTSRLSLLESEALYKGKTVLVIQETTKGTGKEYPALSRRRWDAIFRVRENFDAQMVATYVQNAGKPARVVWVFPPIEKGYPEIPRVLWQRWVKSDISLIGCSEEGVIGGVEWESILFPHNCDMKMIERVLNMRGTGISHLLLKIKNHLSDIASNGAAISWTNIEESDSRGSLYWYDPGEGKQIDNYTKEEAAEVLESIKKWLLN